MIKINVTKIQLFIHNKDKSEMTDNTKKILTLLKKAQKLAYAPYSKFYVSACILANDNNYYIGCNIENAAYPVGCCAEASAISAMIMGGAKIIKEISVLGSGNLLCSPCGACRQKIREFATESTLIHMYKNNRLEKTMTINELLPESFGPNNLKF